MARATNFTGCFNGPGDRSSVAHHSSLNLGANWSIEFWLYLFDQDRASYPVVLSKGVINSSYGIQVDNDATPAPKQMLARVKIGGVAKDAKDPTAAPRGVWTHWCMRGNSSVLQLARNGNQVVSVAAVGAVDANTNPLYIGDSDTLKANNLGGLMYDLRIWNTYRDDATIAAGMNSLPAGGATGLVRAWQMGEGIGAVATDRCSTPQNMSVSNSHQWSSGRGRPY